MPDFLNSFLSSGGFIPHGHCYLWKPTLVWLHVASDSLIALAYYSIPLMLVYFVHKRRDVPFNWIFLMFGTFIVACGTTHLFEVWTLWHPVYWVSGFVKVITAVASLSTAVLLVQLIPKALTLPSPKQLETINQALRNEITQREAVETALRESEERLQAILDNAPAVIYLKDIEGRMLFINRQFESIFQLSNDQIIGKSDYDFFPAEIADQFRAHDRQVLEAGTSLKLEEVAPQDDGSHTYISIKFPLLKSDGEPYAVCGISTDITERKRMEEALQQAKLELEERVEERTAQLAKTNASLLTEIAQRNRTEAELRQSLKSLSDLKFALDQAAIIAITDAQGIITEVNDKFCELSQYSREELIGQSHRLINSAHHSQDFFKHLWSAISDGQVWHGEIRNRAKDGTYYWVDTTIIPFLNDQNKPFQYLAIRFDITERKRAEEKLWETNQTLQALIESAPVSIDIVDWDGNVKLWNPAAEQIFGWSEQEVLGCPLPIIPPDSWDDFLRFLHTSLQTGEVCAGLEGKRIRKDGSVIDVSLYTATLSNTKGEIIGKLGMMTDITERKRVEETLKLTQFSVEQASDAIFWVDSDARILRVNKAACELLGYCEAELLGMTVHDIDPDYQADIWSQHWQELKQRGSMIFESRHKQNDGTIRPTEVNANFIEFGGKEYNCAFTRDITERKRSEAALRSSEERLQMVLQNMPVMMDAFDANGNIIVWNRECERVTGYSAQEIVGNPRAMELLYPDAKYRQPMMAAWAERGHDYRNWEWDIICKDGSIRSISWSNISQEFPIPGWAAWGIGVDISDRKQTEQKIRELNTYLERRVAERTVQLEVANKELEAFSYSVSHDLRAPLRGIDGFSQALLERYADTLDDKGKHYLQRIRVGTKRMGELIDDLLALSRVTRTEMQRTKVDLSALANEIAAELHLVQPERQVSFSIAPGIVADGDARLCRVVLENLFNNAWKFTSNRRQAHIEFNVTCSEHADTVYFVRDNGAGFDMAYANKLFGAFQRLHSTTQFPGTGIGLATVQRIIHRHGGRVWAEGVVEQGATFYFTL